MFINNVFENCKIAKRRRIHDGALYTLLRRSDNDNCGASVVVPARLDEPTAHLDFRRRDELFALLARLGRTVVMAIHELPFDADFFSRVILMSAGRIVADGAPDDVLTETNVSVAYGVPVSVVSRRAAQLARDS